VIQLTRRGFATGAASLAAGTATTVEPSLRLPPSDRPTVALTLDACPGGFDERLARALVENEVRATIFVTALWMRWNPNGLAFLLAHRDLFALQNHGARHLPAILGTRSVYGLRPAGSWDAIETEIAVGAETIQAASGTKPAWYRGASALYSPEVLDSIRRMGFGIGGFSLNADQGASLPAATVAARIARAQSGDVIIGHINQPLRPSGAGIAAGVAALKRQGIAFAWLPG
jgi:peptidoglycan/xylan/chitin deacetylase (PgdA/CDA1 family)